MGWIVLLAIVAGLAYWKQDAIKAKWAEYKAKDSDAE